MLQLFYWKCEECDESNPYPLIKICETCGAVITKKAEKNVLLEIEKVEKKQRKIEKQKAEERKQIFLEEKYKKKYELSKRFFSLYNNVFDVLSKIIMLMCVILIIAIPIYIHKQNKNDIYTRCFDAISEKEIINPIKNLSIDAEFSLCQVKLDKIKKHTYAEFKLVKKEIECRFESIEIIIGENVKCISF